MRRRTLTINPEGASAPGTGPTAAAAMPVDRVLYPRKQPAPTETGQLEAFRLVVHDPCAQRAEGASPEDDISEDSRLANLTPSEGPQAFTHSLSVMFPRPPITFRRSQPTRARAPRHCVPTAPFPTLNHAHLFLIDGGNVEPPYSDKKPYAAYDRALRANGAMEATFAEGLDREVVNIPVKKEPVSTTLKHKRRPSHDNSDVPPADDEQDAIMTEDLDEQTKNRAANATKLAFQEGKTPTPDASGSGSRSCRFRSSRLPALHSVIPAAEASLLAHDDDDDDIFDFNTNTEDADETAHSKK